MGSLKCEGSFGEGPHNLFIIIDIQKKGKKCDVVFKMAP